MNVPFGHTLSLWTNINAFTTTNCKSIVMNEWTAIGTRKLKLVILCAFPCDSLKYLVRVYFVYTHTHFITLKYVSYCDDDSDDECNSWKKRKNSENVESWSCVLLGLIFMPQQQCPKCHPQKQH